MREKTTPSCVLQDKTGRIKDMSVDDMPREKMRLQGKGSLSNAELLGILVSSGTAEKSAVELSQHLLNEVGGIKNLAHLTVDQMMSFKGIKLAKACRIVAALELSLRISKEKGKEEFSIDSPQSIAALFMEELRHEKREFFKALLLDTKHKILAEALVSIGSLNAGLVHPREVFKEAVLRSAHAIILIHNHPSGDPSPSKEDLLMTKQLKQAGEILGIAVLDHVIIGDGVFVSFKEKGLL